MKVLNGTNVLIKGKLYKEGMPIPNNFEKEFSEFLVDEKVHKAAHNPKPASSKKAVNSNNKKEKGVK